MWAPIWKRKGIISIDHLDVCTIKNKILVLKGQPTATDLLDEGVFYKYLAGSWLPWVSHAREDVIRKYQKIHNRPDIGRQGKN